MPAADPPKIEPRALSLTQLRHLAVRGSRRAQAELERRMAEAGPPRPSAAAGPPAPRLKTLASLDQMAAPATAARAAPDAPGVASGITFAGHHDAPPQPSQDAQILRLQAFAQQDEARQRAAGPPGLIGLALMAWGALVLFGGLALFARKGGPYYVLSGLACIVIGWLLLRCKRTAIWAQLACTAVALLWAWRGYPGNTLVAVLIQSAPVWIPAFWIVVPPVREPLN